MWVIIKFGQEAPKDEEHCIEIIFSNDQTIPQSNFRGSQLIIKDWVDGLPISTEYPIAQPGFPRRGQFRHGFDIVSSPIIHKHLKIDLLTEQYNAMHSKRDIKVSVSEKPFRRN